MISTAEQFRSLNSVPTLHVISHHHLGEIIAHDHIPIMFLRRVLTDPSPAEQLLEPIGLGAVIVTRQGRDKQTLAETPGTEENRSVIIFQLGMKSVLST